jgi:hypothetical protein
VCSVLGARLGIYCSGSLTNMLTRVAAIFEILPQSDFCAVLPCLYMGVHVSVILCLSTSMTSAAVSPDLLRLEKMESAQLLFGTTRIHSPRGSCKCGSKRM